MNNSGHHLEKTRVHWPRLAVGQVELTKAEQRTRPLSVVERRELTPIRFFQRYLHTHKLFLAMLFTAHGFLYSIQSPAAGDIGKLASPWSYGVCDDAGAFVSRYVAWCRAGGGTWKGLYATPMCEGSVTLSDDNIYPISLSFSNELHGGGCSGTDSGWGQSISSYQCWSGSPTYKDGQLISDFREMQFSSCTGGGGERVLARKDRSLQCPAGYSAISSTICRPTGVNPHKNNTQCHVNGTNPIHSKLGYKLQKDVDYVGSGKNSLIFERYYNSSGYWEGGTLGIDWRHTYSRRIELFQSDSGATVAVTRANGDRYYFNSEGGVWAAADLDVNGKLSRLTPGGVPAGWRYVDSEDAVEEYDSSGKLIAIVDRAGNATSLIYNDDSNPETLDRVVDSFGNALSFTYKTETLIDTMTISGGGSYGYIYNTNSQLEKVRYPDDTISDSGDNPVRAYLYEDRGRLTGIVDESGNRFATWHYDSSGRGISSEHGDGMDRVDITYNSDGTTRFDSKISLDGSVVRTQTISFAVVEGVVKPAQIQGAACESCGGQVSAYAYDTNGNVTSKTDFNGNITTYIYDLSRNLETSRTEAYGTPQVRTITTQWHATYRLPLLISTYAGGTATGTPLHITAYTYDAVGNHLTRTETDPAVGISRIWSYTYNNYGQVLTADGPRTDVNDITTYTYYNCNHGHECGQLQTVANALGQTTTYNTYNAAGQPLTITDANGVVTVLTYDARNRLTSRSVAGELTSFEYWPTGLLKKVTLPDSSFVSYGYDAAHRLTSLSDSEGNRIAYTLDAAGNRTQEQVFDASNNPVRTRSRVFNALSRLVQELGAASQSTGYNYDNNGNLLSVTDPSNRSTTYGYDALNRLVSQLDPASQSTSYGYDSRDNLVSVTDPKSLTTTYTYNGLGDLKQLASPDTGVTTYTPDAAGNIAQQVDARTQSGTYSYDALGRVTQIQYADQVQDFVYDQGINGKGRLTTLTDASGGTQYGYDAQGRVLSKQQTVGSQTKTVQYAYTNGNLSQLTTPSGQVITYGYTQGKLTGITVNGTPLLSNVVYQPFGPTEGWTWGNGTLTVRQYNADGQLTTIDSAGLTTYSYHPDGTIATQNHDTSANLNLPTGATNFTVSATSNRIDGSTGTLARSYSYDAAGNTLSDGLRNFTYNGAGRMATATNGGITTIYSYNALGQRVKKSNSNGTTYFVYDEQGHLLGEYDQSGTMIQELVWLNDIPVATIRTDQGGTGAGVFYIHTDHLNSPTKITRPSDNQIIWRWDHDPYGNGVPSEDPDGNGLTLAMNLRFPGQYYDSETGLYYNYFRDYDPATGRYIEGDPMGQQPYFWLSIARSRTLKGYWNHLYNYVDSKPTAATDPFGLGPLDWLSDFFKDKAPEESFNSALGSILSTMCIKQNCAKTNRSSVQLWGDCAQILNGFFKEKGPGMVAAIGGITGDAAQSAISDCADRCGDFLKTNRNNGCQNCSSGAQK